MKEKVLIITYYYKHKNAMASVRPIKLAKFFTRQGLDVTVLTSVQKDTWTKEYLDPEPDPEIREIYAPQNRRWSLIQKTLAHRGKTGEKKEEKAAPSPQRAAEKKSGLTALKAGIKKTLAWHFYFNLAKQEDICMYRGLKAEIKRQKISGFDAVIATYPSYGAFLTGIWLKKTGRCKQFIADFRDPLYNPGFRSKKAESEYDRKCLKRVLKAADKVVCVSGGIAASIKEEFSDYPKPVKVVTNGFDKDDAVNAETLRRADGKIHFVYTGALYHGRRCVNMLCEAIRLLEQSGRQSRDKYVFEYAGADSRLMKEQLREYGYEDLLLDHGQVSRKESIGIQQNADALLLLTWNESNYQGVIPGKLFEYMSGGRIPIIALVTGNVAGSEAAEIIRNCDCGFACEEASPNEVKELADYVDAMANGALNQSFLVEPYYYESIAKRYIEIIKE